MISYPFISKITEDDPYGDRAIDHIMERKLNKTCWSNGVFMTNSAGNDLQVIAGNGMNVEILPGACHIEGARGIEENSREVSIETLTGNLKRIDRIVVRMDDSENIRSIEIYKKEGVPSTTPEPPNLIRENNYFELALADVYVKAGMNEITNADILDRRLDSELCGMVVPAFPTPLDLSEIQRQWKAILESAVEDTAAGNLQSQINNVDEKLTPIKSRISTVENIAGTTTKLRNNAFPSDFPIAQLTTYSSPILSGLGANWGAESIRTMGTFDITGTNPKFIKYVRWNGLACIDIILSGNVTINNAQGNAYYSEIKSVTLPSGFTIPNSSQYTIIPSGEFAHASDYATIKGVENGKTINFYIASGYKSPSNPYKVFLRVVYVTSPEDKCIRFWRKK